MAAADDVKSTYGALIKRWAKITELITRLLQPVAPACRRAKQPAPSKLNMPPWEAPLMRGLKERIRDERGAMETTENTHSD